MNRIFLTLTLLVMLYGCNKDSKKAFYYNQTQCSDKWGNGQTTDETVSKLKTYLQSKQISVLSASLIYPQGDLVQCQACGCPTGAKFKVTVADGDEAKIKAEGFY